MTEKELKPFDDLMEVLSKSISELTNGIIQSIEGIQSLQKNQVEDISKSIQDEITKNFEPVVNTLKEKFNEKVIPFITTNMEDLILRLNKKIVKTENGTNEEIVD